VIGPQPQLHILLSVRRAGIGRTLHEDGVLFVPVIGDIDGSKQSHAVTHRDHSLYLGIMLFNKPCVLLQPGLCHAGRMDQEQEAGEYLNTKGSSFI